jgi:hypothetical protein
MEGSHGGFAGSGCEEDNPTVVHLTMYLLALDEQYDWQASELMECLHQAKEAEIFSRMLEVRLVEAHAKVEAVESQETTMVEALKVDEDRHA